MRQTNDHFFFKFCDSVHVGVFVWVCFLLPTHCYSNDRFASRWTLNIITTVYDILFHQTIALSFGYLWAMSTRDTLYLCAYIQLCMPIAKECWVGVASEQNKCIFIYCYSALSIHWYEGVNCMHNSIIFMHTLFQSKPLSK